MLECIKEMGDKAYTLFPIMGMSENTLYQMVRVSEFWPKEERDLRLSFSYYRDAGTGPEAKQIIQAALRNGWSRDQLRAARKSLRKEVKE
jgi:hypothetical protein